MKTYGLWLFFLGKRLLRKPLFALTLLLIPTMVIGLRFSLGAGDAMMRVAVYTPAEEQPGRLATELVRHLTDSSSSAVTFYRCKSEEELRESVSSRQAECGYMIPANLEQMLTDNGTKNRPVVTAYRREDSTQAMLIDEMVASGMYEFIAFEILDEHVTKKTNQNARELLKEKFEKYQNAQAFIEFQYADGSKNKSLSQGDANYMLLPVRGMTAILILLAGMTGTLFFYEDQRKNCFVWLHDRDAHVIPRLYLIAPVALAGVTGLLSLFLTGLASSIWNELLTLFLYLVTVIAFCDFLRQILPRMELFLTAIPFFTGGSLILCPVFANLGSSLAIVSVLQKLTPVYYYLNALHSWRGKLVMAILVGAMAGGIASTNWKLTISQSTNRKRR